MGSDDAFDFDKRQATAPIRMRLPCEHCGELHIDEGEFAMKSHHTHQCAKCGLVWRPAKENTIGVRFVFEQALDKQDLQAEGKMELGVGLIVGGHPHQMWCRPAMTIAELKHRALLHIMHVSHNHDNWYVLDGDGRVLSEQMMIEQLNVPRQLTITSRPGHGG